MNEFSRKLPKWYQLASLLRAEIVSGDRPGGSQVEPEVQLAARYGVSVMPVRQALKSLEAEGLITRQRGRGTFVNAGRESTGFTSLAALYSTEFDRPTVIVERGRMVPPPMFRDVFADQQELCFVRRLAYREGLPWSYGTLYYLARFDDRVTTAQLRRYPIYRLMEDLHGVRIARSTFTARASAASPDLAHNLQIEPMSPVMAMTSITYDASGSAIGAFDMNFASGHHAFSFDVLHSKED